MVTIVGGGIAGLSAAYDLASAGVPHTLIEKQPRLGGVIETRQWDGCVLEWGPDSFISVKPEAMKLIQELGLAGDVIGSNDAERVTYIQRHGKLVRLPEGTTMFVPTRPSSMLASPLVGWGTKIRMGLEFLRRPATFPDRSVSEFVTDHFGRETLDYLAEPLLSGVYGGDPDQLSVASVLPRFVEMERTKGSLARTLMAARSAGPRKEPLFRTLKSGLGCLVERLAAKANVTHGTAEAIERRENAFRVRVNGDWMDADHVVVACPAWAAAEIVGRNGRKASRASGKDSLHVVGDCAARISSVRIRRTARRHRLPGSSGGTAKADGVHLRGNQVSASRSRGQNHAAVFFRRRREMTPCSVSPTNLSSRWRARNCGRSSA